MKSTFTIATVLALASLPAHAANITMPGDFIIGIDSDLSTSNSSFPDPNEAPPKAIDGNNGTKYLNFGGTGTGFIVTPGTSTVRSFQMVTGNDASERDPLSYQIYGTNAGIASTQNSGGVAESWNLISSGNMALPNARNTAGSPISFVNTSAYTSYKMVFPTVNSNLMQFSEVQFYDAPGGSGTAILGSSSPIIGIDQAGFSDSRYPGSEGPATLLDGNTSTKYLNFAKENSGFIVKPAIGSSIIDSFEIWTANDAPERDPASYQIYGANGNVLSANNSNGTAEAWTLIDAGTLQLPATRSFSDGTTYNVNLAGQAFDIYKVVFPTLANGGAANSMQISGFQFYGEAVPEPATASLGLASGLLMLRRRRR